MNLYWFFFERVRNTFRLNFDFGRNVRGRGQTTIEKPVRPRRFLILRLNRTVYTIHRFLSYFRFFVIIGPDWRPVPGWTGRTGRSDPVFKTMDLINYYTLTIEFLALKYYTNLLFYQLFLPHLDLFFSLIPSVASFFFFFPPLILSFSPLPLLIFFS